MKIGTFSPSSSVYQVCIPQSASHLPFEMLKTMRNYMKILSSGIKLHLNKIRKKTEVYRERVAPTRMGERRQRLHDRGCPVGQGRHCCWGDGGDQGGGHPDHREGPHWHWRDRRQRGHAGQAAHTCGGKTAVTRARFSIQ